MSKELRRTFSGLLSGWRSHLVGVGALCLMTFALVNTASATVYRWEDEQGRIYYSETVPPQYQGVAKPVDVPAEPTAEQRRAALERAQKDKAKAAAIQVLPPQLPASTPKTAARPIVKRPAQLPTDNTDCDTWQRLYEESMACFGPFNTVGGGMKQEAFDACNEVAEPPSSRCRALIP